MRPHADATEHHSRQQWSAPILQDSQAQYPDRVPPDSRRYQASSSPQQSRTAHGRHQQQSPSARAPREYQHRERLPPMDSIYQEVDRSIAMSMEGDSQSRYAKNVHYQYPQSIATCVSQYNNGGPVEYPPSAQSRPCKSNYQSNSLLMYNDAQSIGTSVTGLSAQELLRKKIKKDVIRKEKNRFGRREKKKKEPRILNFPFSSNREVKQSSLNEYVYQEQHQYGNRSNEHPNIQPRSHPLESEAHHQSTALRNRVNRRSLRPPAPVQPYVSNDQEEWRRRVYGSSQSTEENSSSSGSPYVPQVIESISYASIDVSNPQRRGEFNNVQRFHQQDDDSQVSFPLLSTNTFRKKAAYDDDSFAALSHQNELAMGHVDWEPSMELEQVNEWKPAREMGSVLETSADHYSPPRRAESEPGSMGRPAGRVHWDEVFAKPPTLANTSPTLKSSTASSQNQRARHLLVEDVTDMSSISKNPKRLSVEGENTKENKGSPTSVASLERMNNDNTYVEPPSPKIHQVSTMQPLPAKSGPKSILRTPRFCRNGADGECPFDEGSRAQIVKKRVRICTNVPTEADEDWLAERSPIVEQPDFMDREGMVVSPIPGGSLLSNVRSQSEDPGNIDPGIIAPPMFDSIKDGLGGAAGEYRLNTITNEMEPTFESYSYNSIDFVHTVAAIVIQAAIRRYLAVIELDKRYFEMNHLDIQRADGTLGNTETKMSVVESKVLKSVRVEKEDKRAMIQRSDVVSVPDRENHSELARKDRGKVNALTQLGGFENMAVRMYDLAAIQIQSLFRGWWLRDSLEVDHYCATLIQRTMRGYQCRKDYQHLLYDLPRITAVQSLWRRSLAINVAATRLSHVLRIQSVYRDYREREIALNEHIWEDRSVELSTYERKYMAATMIQTHWRRYDAYMIFLHMLSEVRAIQACARRYLARTRTLPYLRNQRYQTHCNMDSTIQHESKKEKTGKYPVASSTQVARVAHSNIENKKQDETERKLAKRPTKQSTGRTAHSTQFVNSIDQGKNKKSIERNQPRGGIGSGSINQNEKSQGGIARSTPTPSKIERTKQDEGGANIERQPKRKGKPNSLINVWKAREEQNPNKIASATELKF